MRAKILKKNVEAFIVFCQKMGFKKPKTGNDTVITNTYEEWDGHQWVLVKVKKKAIWMTGDNIKSHVSVFIKQLEIEKGRN